MSADRTMSADQDFEDDSKVPQESWVAHYNGDGPPFWRSNLTGRISHDVSIDGVKLYMPMRKKEEKKEEEEKEGKKKKPIVIGAPKWEEKYDEITGKKSWVSKDGKTTKCEDPYE